MLPVVSRDKSADATMRAVVCTAPDPQMSNLRLTRVDRPEPGRGQVRITVKAASLNPVDWKLSAGVAPWWLGGGAHLVGLDGAGVIDKLGEGVSDWNVDDRVMWHGNLHRHGVLAEQAIAEAHVLSRLPDEVGFQAAAALPCAGLTAYQALVRKARLAEGQSILVQGASGAVGGFAVQIARRIGATVLALARDAQRPRVLALGADHVLDRDSPRLREEIRALTGGYGADVMLEVANPGDARLSLDLIHYNGQLLCVDPLPDLSKVPAYTYGASMHEVALGGAYAAGYIPTQKDFAVMGDVLLALLRDGMLDPLIERVVPLDAAVDELKAMRERSAGGKIVVDIGGTG